GLEGSIDRAVGIYRRIPLVARDLVVEIRLRISPIPHCHDDVSFLSLRPRRLVEWQLTSSNPIGPVAPHGPGALPTHLGEPGVHAAAGLTGLNPPLPRRGRGLELAQVLGNLARRRTAHLVAARATVGVHDVANPLALTLHGRRDAVAARPRAGEVALRRQLKQSEPVLR